MCRDGTEKSDKRLISTVVPKNKNKQQTDKTAQHIKPQIRKTKI